jgi:hypothetical protein
MEQAVSSFKIMGINLIHNMENDRCRRIIFNISKNQNNINHWIDFSFYVKLRISKEKTYSLIVRLHGLLR